jgi:hypothetical protein
MKVADECILNALKVEAFFDSIPTKSKAQKLNYKLIVGTLSDLYYIKKNQLKIDEYEKKIKASDEDYLKSTD